MKKKAQGLSLTTIVIAALAILVLVVLAVIFTGRIGKFTKEAESCQAKGGRCVPIGECKDIVNEEVREEFSCRDPDTRCCIKKVVLGT